jgi:hypothetical protein
MLAVRRATPPSSHGGAAALHTTTPGLRAGSSLSMRVEWVGARASANGIAAYGSRRHTTDRQRRPARKDPTSSRHVSGGSEIGRRGAAALSLAPSAPSAVPEAGAARRWGAGSRDGKVERRGRPAAAVGRAPRNPRRDRTSAGGGRQGCFLVVAHSQFLPPGFQPTRDACVQPVVHARSTTLQIGVMQGNNTLHSRPHHERGIRIPVDARRHRSGRGPRCAYN